MTFSHIWRCAVPLLVVMAASGCADDPMVTKAPPVAKTTEFAFVTTSDFQTGSSSVIWMDGSYTTDVDVAAIHSDAVARYYDGLIYVVNRLHGDNIQILDPADGFSTIRQFSVENGADPHDIAFVSKTKAYVTRYNKTDLWIVDPSKGTQIGSIDLSALADGDGIPEMDHLLLVGNRLFVSVQRIGRDTDWGPVDLSYLAVVDVSGDTLVDVDPVTVDSQPIVLAAANPFSRLRMLASTETLYVACAGKWGTPDGGVEVIDPVTLRSQGIILAGATVGGDITDVAMLSDEKGYILLTDGNFHSVLQAFNPKTGDVMKTMYAPGDFVLQTIEIGPAGKLFLADRTSTKPGVRIFDLNNDEQVTANPLDVGLPPFDITFGEKR